MKKILFFLSIFSLLVFLIYNFLRYDIIIETEKDAYYHYEFVSVFVYSNVKNLNENELRLLVFKDRKPITTIGDIYSIKLKYNAVNKRWEGKWPIAWNADAGEYKLKFWTAPGKNLRIRETSFIIKERTPKKIQQGLCIVTWENKRFLRRMRLKGPDGQKGNWKIIFDWLEWMGADALWFIAGQTSAYIEKLSRDFPWNTDNIKKIDDLISEGQKRGIQTGAWISAYYTFGPKKFLPDYKRGWDYSISRDEVFPTDAISILDETRLDEIIEFAKKLDAMDGLSFIGLDYIVDDYAGMELVNVFVSEMDIQVPKGWEQKSFDDRMKWLAKIVKRPRNRNIPLIDKWNWWRAHRIASLIKQIQQGADLQLPLWAFVLSWEKGWQHGQDPVMFQSAGIDANAVMLYQANRKQFNALIRDWRRYITKEEVNVIVGNQIDWFWHQNTLNPPGPEEFYDRLVTGFREIHKDGPAGGVFVNDLSRAFWGRKGPYSTKEWVIASGAAFTEVRKQLNQMPLSVDLKLPAQIPINEIFTSTIFVQNTSTSGLKNLNINLLLPGDGIIHIENKEKIIEYLPAGTVKEINFKLQGVKLNKERDSREMVSIRIAGAAKPYFTFKYLKLN